MSKRILKHVPGFTGVFAARNGSVWVESHDGLTQIEPKPYNRYLYVRVRADGDAKNSSQAVHRLVALAFHGLPLNEEFIVRHRNDVPTDNRASRQGKSYLDGLLPETGCRRHNRAKMRYKYS